MRILQVASEAYGLCKTGGLADVTTGLSMAMRARGHDVHLLLPGYRGLATAANASVALDLGDPLGVGNTHLLRGRLPDTDLPVWLIECPALYDREGGPYLDASGNDWPDNHLRFGLLGRVAALLTIAGPLVGWTPHIVHGHDWQAGLGLAHLALWGGRRPSTVFTVHNLHFTGRFAPEALPAVGLPPSAYSMHGVEFYGSASFLKAGLYYADKLTTVSPTYAKEIQTPLGGEGLHGLLAARHPDLVGILNGIDDSVWNPQADPFLAQGLDPTRTEERQHLKATLQGELGLERAAEAPLFGLVSRLTWQKGIDLLLDASRTLLAAGGQLAVLGSGDGPLEQVLTQAAAANPGQVAFVHGYNEGLSHRVIAGTDFLVVPSRFEPCGLTQMYAMRYGSIPIVRSTGGLADTVVDIEDAKGTGFTFVEASSASLARALERALVLYRQPEAMARVRDSGTSRDFGWSASAERYLELYASMQ